MTQSVKVVRSKAAKLHIASSILCAVAVMMLSSCNKQSYDLPDFHFKAQVVPQEARNSYCASLDWTANDLYPVTSIQRKDSKGTFKSLPVDKSAPALIDTDVHPGETYSYELIVDDEGVARNGANASIAIPSSNEFKVYVLPAQAFDSYFVAMTWVPNSLLPLTVIQRKDYRGEIKTIALSDLPSPSLSDATVEAGQDYTYYLMMDNKGTPAIAASTTVHVPKDFKAPRQSELKQAFPDIPYGRFELPRYSKTLTMGNPYIINAEYLLCEKATISTFLNEDWMNNPGAHGGQITIRAKRAKGDLTIVALGKRGSTRHLDGGDSARVFVEIEQDDGFDVKVTGTPGAGSPPNAIHGTGKPGLRQPVCIKIGSRIEGDCDQFNITR